MNIGKDIQENIVRAKREGIVKLTVGALISDEDKKVLVVRRAKGEFLEGVNEIPSGGVEDGESCEQALLREVWEETGLTVTHISRYVSSFDYVERMRVPVRQLNFEVTVESTFNVKLSNEHDLFKWVARKDIPTAELDNVMQRLLHHYFGD